MAGASREEKVGIGGVNRGAPAIHRVGMSSTTIFPRRWEGLAFGELSRVFRGRGRLNADLLTQSAPRWNPTWAGGPPMEG